MIGNAASIHEISINYYILNYIDLFLFVPPGHVAMPFPALAPGLSQAFPVPRFTFLFV